MPLHSDQPLSIQDLDGPQPGQRILRLQGPVVFANLFPFQTAIRARNSQALIIDFTGVPYIDSAGIGALVGAYVTHDKEGRSLALVGVNDRVRNVLKATRVEHFFRCFSRLADAEKAEPTKS